MINNALEPAMSSILPGKLLVLGWLCRRRLRCRTLRASVLPVQLVALLRCGHLCPPIRALALDRPLFLWTRRVAHPILNNHAPVG